MGRYPHNVGYVSNGALDSIAAFAKVANNTVGSWLRQAGYHTPATAVIILTLIGL